MNGTPREAQEDRAAAVREFAWGKRRISAILSVMPSIHRTRPFLALLKSPSRVRLCLPER